MDTQRFHALKAAYTSIGQGHVLDYVDRLSPQEQERFQQQLAQQNLIQIQQLAHQVFNHQHACAIEPAFIAGMQPPAVIHLPVDAKAHAQHRQAAHIGYAHLSAGRVAALTVAGGQGTRLGHHQPKGTLPVTPLKQKSLFQVFAEKINVAQARSEVAIPWLIMTSSLTHEPTLAFFDQHQYFGLDQKNIFFFTQNQLPAFDHQGRMLLASAGSLSLAPDGHGGLFQALATSGLLDILKSKGIQTLSYFQVDNPMIQPIDPIFIGFHHQHQSVFSSKTVIKKNPDEKVDLFVEHRNRLHVLEYSDFPPSLLNQTQADGQLVWSAGNIAAHLIELDFIEEFVKKHELPFHLAHKKIKAINKGNFQVEEQPGIKCEQFIFDALPFAQRTMILEIDRAQQFSPIKNASGIDSLSSSQMDQQAQWKSWLQAGGAPVSLSDIVEIAPSFADNQETFIERWASLSPQPTVYNGLYLA